MKIREKISAIYWGAVDKLGPLVPTPQVIGAGLAVTVTGLLDKYAIDLSPFGITPAVIVAVIGFGVAYLIGPERLKATVVDYEVTPGPPSLRVVEGQTYSDEPPELPGEYVGPEDDPDAPGTGLA